MAEPDSNRSPAFQFYPKDFLSDEGQSMMTLSEAGGYIRLVCRCWLEGSIPDDIDRAARLTHTSVKEFAKVWPVIRACFAPHPETVGRLVHPRLEKERLKQALYQRRKADAGRSGGLAKAKQNLAVLDSATSKTLAEVGEETLAKRSSSSSSSSADSSHSSARVISDLPKRRKSLEPDASEAALDLRAGDLLERYKSLFHKHCRGATYPDRMHLNFPKACELVRTWADDDRLDKLAVIVLTTDDEWISRTDRGFSIFATRAAWADVQLAQWEHDHPQGVAK